MSTLGIALLLSVWARAETYLPDWDSLAKHQAAPEWLADAKLGIYFHWGPYTVPAYGNEWYPRHMHERGHHVERYHAKTYGDPAEFGYHDFIPDFTGEHFDPEEWAELFQQAGARYAGPVAEHHDGYAMWASKVTPWNAKDTGPQRDILGELFNSLEQRNIKTIATFHHARHLSGRSGWDSHYHQAKPDWPPNSEDPKLRLLYGNLPEEEWLKNVWLAKLNEVIDQYQPDIIWFDSWLDQIPASYQQRFAAYYLNEANKWQKPVAIIRKQNDLPLSFTINDHEKAREPDIEPVLWMTDDTISTGSWSYTQHLRIKPLSQVLHALIDTVSKNGVVLLNISPKADGTIPQDQREVLLGLGDWLRVNGEAIYATRPWVIAGEGPTSEPHGGFASRKEFLKLQYTKEDIRFTRNKENSVLYAIAMGWPGETLLLRSLKGMELDEVHSVRLLGTDAELKWQQTSQGMEVQLGQKPDYQLAFPVRIEFKQNIPLLVP
ncbi:MAG: alpha-L-fucosidase [Verrucomicrobiota bacterium]